MMLLPSRHLLLQSLRDMFISNSKLCITWFALPNSNLYPDIVIQERLVMRHPLRLPVLSSLFDRWIGSHLLRISYSLLGCHPWNSELDLNMIWIDRRWYVGKDILEFVCFLFSAVLEYSWATCPPRRTFRNGMVRMWLCCKWRRLRLEKKRESKWKIAPSDCLLF